jgi:hypothetical protein
MSAIAIDAIRARWTPYKVVEAIPGVEWRVFYLFPREDLPPNALLFMVPIEHEGPIDVIRDAVVRLMWNLPPANSRPI